MGKETNGDTLGEKEVVVWMPYEEYIFQQKFYELQLRYFPRPIPKEIIEELEKEYVNS